MASLINSDISSSLVRENVQGSAADVVFRRTDLLNFLASMGMVRPWNGGYPSQWNLITAANSATEVFSEGQAAPVAGKQTYTRCSLSPFFSRVVCGVTGHVRDQVRKGGTYDDALAIELQKGTADLMKKVEDTLVGSTQDQGIQSIVDAGDTYAGVAPGSVAAHASLETAVGGALTMATLQDTLETLSLSPYLSAPTHLLSCHNQITNYIDLTGPGNATAANRLARFTPPAMAQGQGRFDLGMTPGGLNGGVVGFNGMDWIPISGLTNTVIIFLDANAGLELMVYRDLEVRPLPSQSDDDLYQISFACALKAPVRKAHAKLTGVTA